MSSKIIKRLCFLIDQEVVHVSEGFDIFVTRDKSGSLNMYDQNILNIAYLPSDSETFSKFHSPEEWVEDYFENRWKNFVNVELDLLHMLLRGEDGIIFGGNGERAVRSQIEEWFSKGIVTYSMYKEISDWCVQNNLESCLFKEHPFHLKLQESHSLLNGAGKADRAVMIPYRCIICEKIRDEVLAHLDSGCVCDLRDFKRMQEECRTSSGDRVKERARWVMASKAINQYYTYLSGGDASYDKFVEGVDYYKKYV